MNLLPTGLSEVFRVQVDPIVDERGLFARTFCADTFARYGLVSSFRQCNTSWNTYRGTLRGMHYQADPRPEVKLVRCTRGKVYDVVIDLRPTSATYKKWIGIELNAESREGLYIPAGCAHGFQTLTDNSELFYQMSEDYVPELARGVRWNDPIFNILWPLSPIHISDRDRQFSDYP
ncbi:dTDP-4-dehydrorhamnose 3,5-epimerase [Bacillus sp. DC4300-2b2]|uniref:dTDP-4-dehydrorhamnose 3,5-epimerase n=1 Tax=Bacillus sp. DC4300-2b2 TaxID=2809038 RepID=UPI003CFAB35A